MRVFCDTNVLLDVLTQRPPFYYDSARVWTLAETGRVDGLVSVLSFANIYYVLGRLKNRTAAQQAMLAIRDIFTPVPFDGRILSQSIDAGLSDFEDAIQLFSARHSNADCIITRNPDHFPTGGVPVQTPAEFLATHFGP